MTKKEKPVVFVQGDTSRHRENSFAQNIIIKALSEGVSDVQELRKLAGMKSAADVYRTLDKMAIRKEYHAALAGAGLDLPKIVEGIRGIAEGAASDSVRLKGWMVLLRSLGLDKYEQLEETGKSWEEVVIQASATERKERLLLGEKEPEEGEKIIYDVEVPKAPDGEAERRKGERDFANELYGKQHGTE